MKKLTANVLKWGGIVIIVLGLLVAAFIGAGKLTLRKAYEKLEAEGRPMRPEQVIPAAIPGSENAALIYQAVVLQLQAEEAGKDGFLRETGTLAEEIIKGRAGDEGIKRFRALMARDSVRQSMAQLAAGTLKKGCRYDLDYNAGAEMRMTHVADLRNLSRILSAQALVAAADGQAGQSWDIAITALRFADALRGEPALISQLLRVVQFQLAAETIQSLAKVSLPTPEQYSEMVALLGRFEDMKPLALALDGERLLFGEWAFQQSGLKLGSLLGDGSGMNLAAGLLIKAVSGYDHARYIELMLLQAKSINGTFSTEDEKTAERLILRNPRFLAIMTGMLVPALGNAKSRYFSMVAQARVLKTGLSVLKQAGSGGGYPDKLAVDAGNVMDPFTGRPLLYRKTDTGFVLYSVGPNQRDDGGVAGAKRGEGDIVWQYAPKGKTGTVPGNP